jgi:hypothetical protein
VPNPANPKPAAITAVAAAKRAYSFISPCYQGKLCIKTKEAERKLYDQRLTAAKVCSGQRNT